MVNQPSPTVSVIDVNRELYVRNAELAVRNKTLVLLQKMSKVTLQALEVDAMIEEIVSVLDTEFSYPFAAIGLCGPRGKHLHWKAIATPQKKISLFTSVATLHRIVLTSRSNACASALRNNRRAVARSLDQVFDQDFSHQEIKDFTQKSGLKTSLIFPLVLGGHPVGVLVIGMNRSSKALTRYEKETFQSLLGLVTVAVQKAETYEHLQNTTKQLRVANSHLRELDSVKTEFLSIASHQLRTPLAVLKGYIGMLNGGLLGALQPKQQETLVKMQSGTEQLIMLVNHLLDVSRIEANRLQVRLELVDLAPVLDGLVKFIQEKAREKNIALLYALPAEPMRVNVDSEKVKEVFMNLLDNAVKYTDKGKVEVDMRQENHQVIVSITDTGHGLTAKDQEKLFQKFVTGSASVHVKTTTGLGLYVCRKLTEAMNGTVTASSKGEGKGSVFTVTFPQSNS